MLSWFMRNRNHTKSFRNEKNRNGKGTFKLHLVMKERQNSTFCQLENIAHCLW